MNADSIDLLALIGRDVSLRRAAGTHGGEYAGACPLCGGRDKRDADRFRVWPAEGRFWCRRCGKKGDAIQYVRERFGLSFAEALDRLGLACDKQDKTAASVPLVPAHAPADPPSDVWQARAILFCQTCEDALWSPEGARALTWLREVRGLSDETIRDASLGYNPEDRHEAREAWGLSPEEDENGRPKSVWLPRGVVIPWLASGHLWRVNIRRPTGDPKYIGPAGWHDALYRADTLAPGAPAVLVEGDFDALTVYQYAGGIAAAVATGSTTGARRVHWLASLALSSMILVAFDGDDPGEEAARYWLHVLPNARRWRPYYGKDANGLATAGGGVRQWILAGLSCV